MKKTENYGEGLCGLTIVLNNADMHAAKSVCDELKTIAQNRTDVEKYKSTPFDERKKKFPEGEPKKVEISDQTLSNLITFMGKIANVSVKSTIFEKVDENDL